MMRLALFASWIWNGCRVVRDRLNVSFWRSFDRRAMPLFPIVIVVIATVISALPLAADDAVTPQVMLGLNTSGHNGHVTRLVIDRVRSQLISVSHDKTIRFWDLDTYSPIRVLRPPIGRGWVGELSSASLSPDSQWLAVSGYTAPEGTNDHSILLIDLPEGRLVRRLRGNTLPVQDLAFSPDGQWLAAGGTDGILRIWETADWTLAKSLPGHTARIDSLAWSPDSSRLVTGSWDRTCRFWSVKDGTSVAVQAHGGRKVYCVAWSPDGQNVATGGGDDWVHLWDPYGRLRMNLVRAPEAPEMLAFSPDGSRLVYGWGGNQLNPLAAGMIRLADRMIVAQYFGHLDTVLCSTFSPDGRFAIIGDSDDQICVWEADTGRLMRRIRSEGLPIYGAGFSPDGRTIGCGYRHVPGSSLQATNPLHRSFSLEQLQFGPTPDFTYIRGQTTWGNLSIIRSNYQRATISQGGAYVSSYYDPTIAIRSRTMLPGNRAAVGCDQSVVVFDALTGHAIYRLPGHLDAVWAVTPSPDQKHLLTGSDDETLQIWNLERYEHTLSLFFAGDDWVAWTPQGYYAASPGGENYVGWHVQRSFDEMASYYPAARFHSRFYNPELIRRVVAFGGPMQALKELDRIRGSETRLIDIKHSLPPVAKLEISSLSDPDQEGLYRVEATAQPAEGDSIRSLRLLIDGRPGPETHDREELAPPPAPEIAAGQGPHVTWQVKLAPGKHRLALKADSDRSSGISEVTPIEFEPQRAARPRLFVLVIGVGANFRPDLRRPLASADAQAVFATLAKPSSIELQDIQTRLLVDQQVSRFQLEAGFQLLQQNMTPDDIGLIYYSGCVLRDAEDSLYFQHQESRFGDPAAGIPERTLRTVLQETPGRILLMLDVITRDDAPPTAPPAAAVAPTPENVLAPQRRSMADLIRELASEEMGIAVLANVNDHEALANLAPTGRSPFAQSIIDACAGKADSNADGVIDIKELIQFVRNDMKSKANGAQRIIAAQPAFQPPTPVIGVKASKAGLPGSK